MKTIIFIFMLSSTCIATEYHLVDIKGLIRGQRHAKGVRSKVMKFAKKNGLNIKYYSWDIPGNGSNFKQVSHTDMKLNTDSIRKKFLAEGLDKKTNVYMLAVSLGGMIGLDWLNRYPNDFDKAYVANSSSSNACGLFDRFNIKQLPSLLKGVLLGNKYKEEGIFEATINYKDKNKDLVDYWVKLEKENPVSIFNTIRQLYSAITFSVPKKVPFKNVTILSSINDRFVSSKCSRNTAKMLGAPIIFNKTAGHDIMNDAPEWVLEQIEFTPSS